MSLVGGPDLEDPADPTRVEILKVARSVAEKDAEFILKVFKNINSGISWVVVRSRW